MAVDLITGSLLVAVVSLVWWLTTRRPSSFPPGPRRLPLLGNILTRTRDSRVSTRRMRRQYGDIFSVYVFNQPLIIMSGYETLKDALVKNGEVFCYRPHSILTRKEKGIVSTSGAVWKEQRRFALSTLRDLGMGKSVIEDKIQEELSVFLEVLEDEKGQPFDCSRVLHNAVSNIICSVVFGKRFNYTDPLFVRFLTAMQENFSNIQLANMVFVLPLLKYLPGDLFKIHKVTENRKILDEELIQPSVDKHMQDDDNSDDFISAYLKEMHHRQQKEEETSMDLENLSKVISDLFAAGTETTATTLRWTLVYFLNYPDVQEKCFQEIRENIGLNRPPSMKDKTRLPYLEATIMEVLRYGHIAPTTPPYTVPHDVQFRGFTFPKGVTIIPMLFTVMEDPDIWGDPENFRPQRFLDDTGKLRKIEAFIPFSLGRRVCLGESLARMELFMFLASMVQRFEFVPVNGVKPSMEGDLGITLSPKPFSMTAVPRN